MSEARGAPILAVDDEEDILDVVGDLLEADGHRCLRARSGQEALAMLEHTEPALVLTDLQMSPGDGFEVLEETRKRYPAVPVVIMTGHGTMESAIKALRMGAADFITKPFDLAELQRTVGRNLRLCALQRENRELQIQVEASRELDRMQRDFISNVSHELRTPTAIIKEFVAILREQAGEALSPDQREYLDIMDRNIQRLLRMVENMLELTRAEAGTLRLQPEELDLAAHLRVVLKEMRAHLEEKQITVRAIVPDGPLTVFADPDAVTQVFVNLLENARKYSKAGTSVTVTLEGTADTVQASVADQGLGRPPEKLEEIFERFKRIESEKYARQAGAGLGLPIVRELLRLLNGTITVESRLGEGSTFTFTLPRRPPVSAEEPAPVERA